ncbi:MAG: outer membrane protein assembly factor BamA [Saprospiraceae bacterium]
MRKIIALFACCCLLGFSPEVYGQVTDSIPTIDYSKPTDFEIGGIVVTGEQFSDENAIVAISGLKVGDKIRVGAGGTAIPRAIKSLMRLRLFTDVQVYIQKTIGDIVFLELNVKERARLSRYSYKGVKKSYHDDLNDGLGSILLKGGIVTENIKVSARTVIEDFYKEKGYLDVDVKVLEKIDEGISNSVQLVFDVDRNKKVKVQRISFIGNENIKSKKLRKTMDNTKRRAKWFSSSKLIKPEYETDKKSIIAYYNTIGFRDARILKDSIWRGDNGHLQIQITIEEGQRYYFRDISWKGNSIYETKMLSNILGINAGDVYNQELLDTRLRYSLDGRDVSTIYMDNGYLFFQVNPIEVAIDKDSIDMEIRIFEGPQATIDRVVINGNDRTHEDVIRRELRTRPGQKFSRTDIIRSQREIINLGYFNPEALGINTPVNAQRGTVDIEYTVEEKPSDQLELSAGWAGAGRGVIGTLGVSFNNFSLRNIFKKEAWNPLPQGDGQRLSLRAQTSGKQYQSYNISFTEPWLGGKKPTSFTISGFHNRFTFGTVGTSTEQRFNITGGSIAIGTRLKFPDDNFISQTAINIQNLFLKNGNSWAFFDGEGGRVADGSFLNFSIKQTFTRSSIDDPIFPKNGSKFTLSAQLTPPYSLFNNKDYSDLPASEKFKWLEYHKWRFNAEWYTRLAGNLVLKAAVKIGMLGFYNEDIGLSPFERFQLGGDGFANQQFGYIGTDLISLRGYEINELDANVSQFGNVATPVFDKFTVELRYPISLNPSSTIFVLGFVEGGNSWGSFSDFNPFDVRRSAGMGLRVFLPMFGTLGFDYGIGFDKPELQDINARWTQYGNFNIILGFEPE